MGLKITPNFDSVVNYEVYFYDVNLDFMSCSGKLSTEFDSRPEFAKYCRIVITPKEDQKISWYEVSRYAKQINIIVDKEQNFLYETNLFKFDETKNGHTAPNVGESILGLGSELSNVSCSKVFEVSSYSKLIVFVPNVSACQYTNLVEADVNYLVTRKTVKTINVDNSGDLVKLEYQLSAGTEYASIVHGIGGNVLVYGV